MRLAGHDTHQINCKVELRDKDVYICLSAQILKFSFVL